MDGKEIVFLALLLSGFLLAVSVPNLAPQRAAEKYDTESHLREEKGETFVVYGDTRTGLSVHRRIVSRIKNYSPDFIVNTGDLVEDGSKESLWRKFMDITDPLKAEYLPAVGNHGLWRGGGKKNLLSRFPQVSASGYYSVKRAGIKFVFLNQYVDYSPGSRQYEWFERELMEGEDEALIVVAHEPHFRANHDANEKTAEYLVPLMEEYGVEAVFYGHSHMFGLARREGIPYVVTGGGGAPLYGPNESTLDVHFKRHHFVVFEKVDGKLDAEVVALDGSRLYEFSISLRTSTAGSVAS